MNRQNPRNVTNKDKNVKKKEDLLKHAEVLEKRAFGKDLKNVTYRSNSTKDVIDEKHIKGKEEKEKGNLKSHTQSLKNDKVDLHKNNENSENNENPVKKFKMSDLSDLEYVKVGNTFVKKTKPKGSNSKLEEFEKEVQHDPQFFIEYFRDTLTHLKCSESINSAKIGYMTTQPQISEIMRAKLIDWLMEVHIKFNLLPETLFLTVNLIDRFLFIKKINTKDFQLLGVSAMFIGCKYEEIYPPEVRDFVYATGKTYTDVDIIKMEGTILAALQFETLHVSSFRFLEWFHLVSHDDTERMSFFLAQFLLELALIDYNMLKYSSSLLAASALNFARKYLKVDPNWSTTLQTYSGYKYKDLIECNEDLSRIVKGIIKSTFKIAIKKFFSSEYKKIASLLYEEPKEERAN